MNPSASGWILKFLNLFEKSQLIDVYNSETSFYFELKSIGFLYGTSLTSLMGKRLGDLKITKQEYTKINLFHGLLFTFFNTHPTKNFEAAIEDISQFYEKLEKGRRSFFQKLSLTKSASGNLEYILSSRLSEANTDLEKNSTSVLTYAMLYLDILSYRHFVQNQDISVTQLKNHYEFLEASLIHTCFMALSAKSKKNKGNLQLIELYTSSADYFMDGPHLDNSQEDLSNLEQLEKQFILDLCCLTIWENHELDDSERMFLEELIKVLHFSEEQLNESIESIERFTSENEINIKLFEYANPITELYKQSTRTVKKLILRNKTRLINELNESGELLLLLGQTTVRDLSHEEKSRVKEQLLDICKTIPSLTIFLLPGGTLLLPLLVKYIPSLLPSAFQENKIKKKDL